MYRQLPFDPRILVPPILDNIRPFVEHYVQQRVQAQLAIVLPPVVHQLVDERLGQHVQNALVQLQSNAIPMPAPASVPVTTSEHGPERATALAATDDRPAHENGAMPTPEYVTVPAPTPVAITASESVAVVTAPISVAVTTSESAVVMTAPISVAVSSLEHVPDLASVNEISTVTNVPKNLLIPKILEDTANLSIVALNATNVKLTSSV
ncbi:hypothetical protein niasHT_018321 [Heterodera trifolii]|uniref:Uncharacterized protein n=1 Tax=Heterodera trifolii TaxID=157864 RepID=A0ABD2LFV1_9BILA